MTIKEISEALNVSISTVSKALNDATDIAEETKNTVRQYAAAMGYHVRSKNQPTRRICALYERVNSDTRNNILNHVISAFTDIAIAHNFEVVTDFISSKPEGFVLEEYLKQNNFCAAFIVGMTFKSPVYKQLKNTTVPLVLMDNHVNNAPLISSVSSENTNAIVKAIKHLNKLGHQKIGLLMGERESYVSAERLAGYILGLARVGIDFNNDYVYYGDFTKNSGEEAANFFNETDVTAVICCSDIMAMGLIDGLKSLEKRIPEDISVIGFDDLNLLKFTSYNLTTLKQDFNQMGVQAFKQIADMLEGRNSQRVMLNCELIERGTVIERN
ncbi:MAG: LacI family transcriptional regulator [Clostridia bacterium]|nr:LacI family transcriptional regulator [Clostridia bacterium]